MNATAKTGIARLVAWFVLGALVIITLGPRRLRPVTGVEHHLEHFLAFALMAFVFARAYPRRRLAMGLIGIVAVALLEILQRWSPGRHATLSDFGMNALGLVAGLATVAFLEWCTRRSTP